MHVSIEIQKPHLIADVPLGDVALSLDEWSWLLGDGWSPILVTAAGDVFLTNEAGAVARLDTGAGTLDRVAETHDAFEAALDDPEVVADWFLEPVVEELREQGNRLGRGQCYGFTILPIFQEGSYAAPNRFCLDAIEHIRLTGSMHFKLADVADGESVRIKVTD
jgi:hypothetical protein